VVDHILVEIQIGEEVILGLGSIDFFVA